MSQLWPLRPELAERLETAAKEPSHAYLLVGGEQSGVYSIALIFASAILGESIDVNEIDFAHTNLVVTSPLDGKQKVSIAQVQEIIASASQTGFLANKPKIYIIDRAEQLSREAATALLKTLEEPSPSVVFILTSDNVAAVLPTIRSRASVIAIPKLSADELRDYLVAQYSVEEAKANKIVSLSAGRLEIALSLLDPERLEAYSTQQAQAQAFSDSALSEKFAIAKTVTEAKQTRQFLDMLYYAAAPESSILVAASNQEKILNAEQQLGNNINPRLVVENLALHWSNNP